MAPDRAYNDIDAFASRLTRIALYFLLLIAGMGITIIGWCLLQLLAIAAR